MSSNQSTSQSVSQVNQSTNQVKMYSLDYNPGNVPGHIVLKKSSPVFEERSVIVGYEWVENDIGSWMGPQRIQVPIYETQRVCVGRKETWDVYTEDEFKKFEALYA